MCCHCFLGSVWLLWGAHAGNNYAGTVRASVFQLWFGDTLHVAPVPSVFVPAISYADALRHVIDLGHHVAPTQTKLINVSVRAAGAFIHPEQTVSMLHHFGEGKVRPDKGCSKSGFPAGDEFNAPCVRISMA